MALSTKKIINLASIGLVAAGLIGGNIAAYINSGAITQILCGTGVSFDGAEVERSQALGDELCKDIGREGIVLLKNAEKSNGKRTLPLSEDITKVNVFGAQATDSLFLLRGVGSGSSTINQNKKVTLLQALKNFNVEYNETLINSYKSKPLSKAEKSYDMVEYSRNFYTQDMIDQAKNYSNTAIMVLSRTGGENMGEIPTSQTIVTESGTSTDSSRTYLDTTVHEEALMKLLRENFENVIVLVNTANNMHLNALEGDEVDAALFVGLSGQSSATAIPELIWGYKVNDKGEKELLSPSGKVTDIYSYEPDTQPSFVNREKQNNHIQYVEDIYYGYKWYETADAEGYWNDVDNQYGKGYDGVVQYPFGYGLSYTEFEWKIVEDGTLPNGTVLSKYSPIEVKVEVTNVGEYPGKDVVELYVTPPYKEGEIEKAHVNLMAFAKTTTLKPGETQYLTLKFNPYDMSSYDCYDKNNNGNARWELDAGDYEVKLMTDSHNMKSDELSLTYKVPEGGIKYNLDPKTKQIVKNRMTGETAYSGVPIDGSTVGAETSYLSRSGNFANVPTKHAKTPSNSSEVSRAANYFNTIYDGQSMPTTGVDSGLRLVTLEDGTKASLSDLKGETGKTLKINEELFEDLSKYNSATWDTLLNQMTTKELTDIVEIGGFRTIAVESIGKPQVLDCDGPAGFNQNVMNIGPEKQSQWTAYPSETLIGCTWNAELAYRIGLSMGVEASATGISGWYAPGVNLHRSPYTARNFEYYSEDGVLSGKLAAETIRGAKHNGLYCYLKHFVLSEPGPNPSALNTWVTEQNLRENYLKPFEIAVKEGGANAIMSAFNRVGANWAGASYPCLTQILRTEWGFRGVVLTDWSPGGGVGAMNPGQGVRAGNDIWLNPNEVNNAPLSESNPVDVYCARKSAKNILFTYIDTYVSAKKYAALPDDQKDDRYNVEVGVKVVEAVDAWWIPLLIGIDILAAALLGLWAFLVLKKKELEPVLAEGGNNVPNPDDELKLQRKNELLKEINELKKQLKSLKEELKNLSK